MGAEDEDGLTSEQRLTLEATFKAWDFLEESGFGVDELVGKDVSFIVGTPEGGGRRLGVNNLMREIDEVVSRGEACEVCFLQAIVSDSEGSAPNPPWDHAEFPVCQLPHPRSERVSARLLEEPTTPPKIEAVFFPRHGPPCRVELPYASPQAHRSAVESLHSSVPAPASPPESPTLRPPPPPLCTTVELPDFYRPLVFSLGLLVATLVVVFLAA